MKKKSTFSSNFEWREFAKRTVFYQFGFSIIIEWISFSQRSDKGEAGRHCVKSSNYWIELAAWMEDKNRCFQRRESITFTLKMENCQPIKINDVAVPKHKSVKYLSIHFDPRLSLARHIAAKIIKFKYRTAQLYWRIDLNLTLVLELKLPFISQYWNLFGFMALNCGDQHYNPM